MIGYTSFFKRGDGYEEKEDEITEYRHRYGRDMDEIAEVMKSDADAETKCKMISNILTAKPHYFKMQEPKESEDKALEQEPILDKIKAKIKARRLEIDDELFLQDYFRGLDDGLSVASDIIDECIAESEDRE